MTKKILLIESNLPQLVKKDGSPPHIIFLDINMPMTNSWERLKELKQLAESRGIVIIMYFSSDIGNEGIIASDTSAAATGFKSWLSGFIRSCFRFDRLNNVPTSRPE